MNKGKLLTNGSMRLDSMINVEVIKRYVAATYPRFGVNKRIEVVRLLFEIAKREDCDFKTILDGNQEVGDYTQIKNILLKRRFPRVMETQKDPRFSMTELDINPDNKMVIASKLLIRPKCFYVEETVLDSDLVARLKAKFTDVPYKTITSYKDYNESNPYCLIDYNKRIEKIFIIKENYDFLLRCPCTSGRVTCGYNILNLGTGCGYECVYCFLQSYTNSHGIIIPANINDFFKTIDKISYPMRIGTGQFTDSLIFDPITEYSKILIDYFQNKPHLTFEFKTKSNNIENILSLQPSQNIVVSWSLNPQIIIDKTELYTTSLTQRLQAAKICQEAGYRIGFHFDPIIYYEHWETAYKNIIDEIFDSFDHNRISWMSLGCLRMTPKQKQVIENRFPETDVLNEEFVLGYDDKLRYPFNMRCDIYQKMVDWIRRKNKKTIVYLCMESPQIYKHIKGEMSFRF